MTTEDPLLQQFQQIQEIQNQIENLNTQISRLQQRIQQKSIKLKRLEAGIESLDAAGEQNTVYKQVSQMLLLIPKEELRGQLIKDKESFEDLPKLQTIRDQLVSRLSNLNIQLLDLHKQVQRSTATNPV